MRTSPILWRTIGLVSLVFTLILLFGFGYAVNDLLYSGPQPPAAAGETSGPAKADDSRYVIAALGDSLTQGTGDETGEGYVGITAELLKQRTGKAVTVVNNLAIGGMRADQLADKLKSDKGYRYALQQANLILLTIGGNDLFQAARSAETAAIDPERIRAGMQEGLSRLDDVLRTIGAINPDAQLVYVGLYNPFYDVPELRAGSEQVQEWNAEAYRMLQASPNGRLVPVFDLFERNIGAYLSPDHFHPNHDGYARIAERIVQALT